MAQGTDCVRRMQCACRTTPPPPYILHCTRRLLRCCVVISHRPDCRSPPSVSRLTNNLPCLPPIPRSLEGLAMPSALRRVLRCARRAAAIEGRDVRLRHRPWNAPHAKGTCHCA